MARLNESTAPPESIDALKRRFVRQNREIARINSIQSLRIRSLESEISHLLSENVSLREQLISLSQEVERLGSAKVLQDGVHDVKAKLDAKLAELGSLVTDLGSLPRKFHESCDAKSKSTSPRRPGRPSPGFGPRTINIQSQLNVDDGRLPAILEDKYYPRETLEPQELQYLKNNEHDGPKSSEMEEPSVGQLDTDYTNLAPEYLGELDQTQVIHTGEVDNGHLPPTLEVRRKKKKSNAAVQDENTPSSRPASFITPTGSDYTRKSGSKRKFDPEEDDKYVTASVSSDDGFEFSRSSQVPHKASDNIISEHEVDSPSKKQMNGRRGPRNREQPKRKVLEPKSANISVGSHNKTNSAKVRDYKVQPTWDGENKNPESLAEEVRNKTSQKHDINANSESYGSNVLEATNEVDNAKRASATASSRLLLPAPLESQGQETPGLGENGPTAPSRTTRRQKAVVSYTEPNLRDKMRRPTGDFIDAVGNRRTRRSSNAQAVGVNAIDDAEIPSYTADSGGLGIADKDRESLVNPLGGPISMVSQRKRRTLPAKEDTSHPSASEDGRGSNVIYGDMTNDNNVTPMVKGGSGGKGRGIHAAKRTPTELEHPESSDHALGEGSSHEELETDQSSKRLPFSVVDARRIKRGQRTAARRRSMMV